MKSPVEISGSSFHNVVFRNPHKLISSVAGVVNCMTWKVPSALKFQKCLSLQCNADFQSLSLE